MRQLKNRIPAPWRLRFQVLKRQTHFSFVSRQIVGNRRHLGPRPPVVATPLDICPHGVVARRYADHSPRLCTHRRHLGPAVRATSSHPPSALRCMTMISFLALASMAAPWLQCVAQTHLPGVGSTLIDGGDPAIVGPPATDQRGLARIDGDSIDIGAVEVEIANLPPVGLPDAVTVGAGGAVTINVLGNDSDPETDPLTVVSVTQGAQGSVTISAGQVLYLASAGASGVDTFTYTLSDGENLVTVTVTVTIRAAGTLPATGAETDLPLAAGVALTLLGGAMVAGTRRRRPAR